jgi:hypothetical protein
MADESAPSIEIDGDPTEANDSPPTRPTSPHATEEWLAGYEQGWQRGQADVLDALRRALGEVGVTGDVARAIVARVRARAEKSNAR